MERVYFCCVWECFMRCVELCYPLACIYLYLASKIRLHFTRLVVQVWTLQYWSYELEPLSLAYHSLVVTCTPWLNFCFAVVILRTSWEALREGPLGMSKSVGGKEITYSSNFGTKPLLHQLIPALIFIKVVNFNLVSKVLNWNRRRGVL